MSSATLAGYDPDVYGMLRRFKVAFCIFEIAGFQSPVEITSDFAYVRLHGPGERAYQGEYTKAQLRVWAELIAQWQKRLQKAFVYFDNDQAGFAAKNALEFKRLVLGERSSSPAPQQAA